MAIATPGTIRRIPTDMATVHAFRIVGKVSADDMKGMAQTMNAAFDTHDTVSMLLIFDHFDGAEAGAGFDMETLKSQFRALADVDRYAVVGAPDAAETMIAVMDKIIPTDARTFDAGQEQAAWQFVGARPITV